MEAKLRFEDFYAAEFQRVYKAIYITSRDPDLAYDVTQEAFKRAFVRWWRLGRQWWAGGWVMTTALNLMRQEFKRPRHSDLSGTTPPAVFQESQLPLLEALRDLPHRQRAAALLYYVGDLPVGDIARSMEIEEGTVKALLSQARRNLRRSLGRRWMTT